jgi:hypothetical protein
MDVCRIRFAGGEWSAPFPAWDGPKTVVIAFAAPGYADHPEVLAGLAAAFPTSAVIGCSTSGEMDQTAVCDDSVVVAVVRFSSTTVRRASTDLAALSASFDAGARLAEALAADDLRAVFVLSEGLTVNGSELARGLHAGLRSDVVVTGGLAGDGDRFAKTWVWDGGRAEPGRVVAVGLYGDAVRVTHGSKGGWDAFGPERMVTRSEGNVLFSVDGRPALALYKEYLGQRAAELPASALLFPLALRAPDQHDNSVVRTVLAIDEASQSMTFAGHIPTGHYARLMRANFDRLVLGAQSAGVEANSLDAGHSGPVLSIAVSCVGRRLVLGERTEEEAEATLAALPEGAEQVGFYSYGELSPLTNGKCELHNQTMTLTVWSERG